MVQHVAGVLHAGDFHLGHHLQPLAVDEVRVHKLDVSDGKPWRELHFLLELAPPPETVPVDEIAQTNYARFLALPPATAWIIKPSPRE